MADTRAGLALGRATVVGAVPTVIPEADVTLEKNTSAKLRYWITKKNVTDGVSECYDVALNAHRETGAAVIQDAAPIYESNNDGAEAWPGVVGSDGLIQVTVPGEGGKTVKYVVELLPLA